MFKTMESVVSCERRELTILQMEELIARPGYHYGLTISINSLGLETTSEDLLLSLEVIPEIADRFLGIAGVSIPVYAFEAKPRTGHLHVHAYVTSPIALRYTDLRVKGEQHYYKMLVGPRNRRRWLDYMNKQSRDVCDQIHWTKYFSHPTTPSLCS